MNYLMLSLSNCLLLIIICFECQIVSAMNCLVLSLSHVLLICYELCNAVTVITVKHCQPNVVVNYCLCHCLIYGLKFVSCLNLNLIYLIDFEWFNLIDCCFPLLVSYCNEKHLAATWLTTTSTTPAKTWWWLCPQLLPASVIQMCVCY